MRKYRRRVPRHLQSSIGMKEIVRNLGRTDDEVLRRYQLVHVHVENLFSGRSIGPEKSSLELSKFAEAKLIELDLDPFKKPISAKDIEIRGLVAEKVLSKYASNPETGQPDSDDVSPEDHAFLEALFNGAPKSVAPTIAEAFDFYLQEKKINDAFKRKKQVQRFRRTQKRLLEITRSDLPITSVTRHHARALRDTLDLQTSAATVRRYFNDVKAVINFTITEFELSITNPFAKIDLPTDTKQNVEKRTPIPFALVHKIYAAFDAHPMHRDFCILMHHTGARNAEILGLTREEFDLHSATPHVEIKENVFRSIKKGCLPRKVPLIGDGLAAAQRLTTGLSGEAPVFGLYAATNKHDTFGQVANRLIQEATERKELTAYGFRHLMKDNLQRTDAPPRVSNAILGHSNGSSASTFYGSSVSLEEMFQALREIDFAGMISPNVEET